MSLKFEVTFFDITMYIRECVNYEFTIINTENIVWLTSEPNMPLLYIEMLNQQSKQFNLINLINFDK